MCVCVCVCVFVFVWTMTVSVVPEELMSRWSEWDSAYSLSLLFTLALMPLPASVFVRVYVSVSRAVSLSFFLAVFFFFFFLFYFISVCYMWIIVQCAACAEQKTNAAYFWKKKKWKRKKKCCQYKAAGLSQDRNKCWKTDPSVEVTCNMGVLTPVLECMFDVAMNKSLQELSSSVTEAVQCYMTQRTLDNALRPHTHTHTHTHTQACILYIPSLTRCRVYWLLQWHGSATSHLADVNAGHLPSAHTTAHTHVPSAWTHAHLSSSG